MLVEKLLLIDARQVARGHTPYPLSRLNMVPTPPALAQNTSTALTSAPWFEMGFIATITHNIDGGGPGSSLRYSRYTFYGEIEPLHRVLNLLIVSLDKIVPKWPP
jgi:hypothetical protein